VAAASILVLAGTSALWLRERRADAPDVFRGAESPVVLVSPVGNVRSAQARHFAWRAVTRAQRYTLVVVDTTGAEMFASETRDTVMVLPDTVRLAPGRTYMWWVQARLADESTVTAVTQRLVVTPR
jgi:hypothetical protein